MLEQWHLSHRIVEETMDVVSVRQEGSAKVGPEVFSVNGLLRRRLRRRESMEAETQDCIVDFRYVAWVRFRLHSVHYKTFRFRWNTAEVLNRLQESFQ